MQLYSQRSSSLVIFLAAWSSAVSSPAVFAQDPAIDVWYGSSQRFGDLGVPQPWINILGNVSPTAGGSVSGLSYTLNGSSSRTLNFGPDSRRLADAGDFNIDISTGDSSLAAGTNTVTITAQDSLGNSNVAVVTFEWTDANVWPLPYSIADWSAVTDLEDVVQIVDGHWAIDGSELRPLQLDYDRLVVLGDSWTDYEVEAVITILGFDPGGFDPPSNDPAVGVCVRWPGHSVTGSQPNTGFLPLGAIGWYRFKQSGVHQVQIVHGEPGTGLVVESKARTLALSTAYRFKMRVKTVPGAGSLYSLKIWPDGGPEPSSWDLEEPGPITEPAAGSVGLLSHHVDARFGEVAVTPLGACPSGVVSYWPLGEVSGTDFADLPGGNDGACSSSGCPTPTSGIAGTAQDFDGNDEITVPSDPSLDFSNGESFTFEAWAAPESIADLQIIVGRTASFAANGGLQIWLGIEGGTGKPWFFVKDTANGALNAFKGNMAVNLGEWNHIVGVRDAAAHTVSLYLNGARLGNPADTAFAGDFSSATAPVTIGHLIGSFHFDGAIDEVAIYSEALSAAAVQEHYNDGLLGLPICADTTLTVPEIVSTPPAEAPVGTLYSYDVLASGNPPPIFDLLQAPAGMTVNAATGLIEWTPDAGQIGFHTVEVRAMNSEGADTQLFDVEVTLVPPEITSTPTLRAVADRLFEYDVQATGSPAPDFALLSAPAAMTIDPVTGLIDWTPTVADIGLHTIEIEAANFAGSDTQIFELEVVPAPECPSGVISIWPLDETSGPSYEDIFSAHDVSCSACPIPTAGVVGGAQTFDGTATLSVPADPDFDFSAAESFSFEVWFRTQSLPSATQVLLGRADGFGAGDGLQVWLGLEGGTGKVWFWVEDANGARVNTLKGSAPTLGSWHHLAGVRDASTSQVLLYFDGALALALPAGGLTGGFATENGASVEIASLRGCCFFTGDIDEPVIYATALAAADVADHYQDGLAARSVCAEDPPSAPAITSTPVTNGTIGVPYVYDVSATGFPLPFFDLLQGPAAMTIDPVTGLIEWTPGLADIGHHTVEVEASNSEGSDTQIFEIDVAAVPPVITSAPPLTAPAGALYRYDVDATGAPAPAFSLVTAPAGMTIDSGTGQIEWTPTVAEIGFHPVEVEAANFAGTDTQSFSIEVQDLPTCPADLVAYWPLDEVSGTSFADPFSGHGASCASCPIPIGGQIAGAQDFDGSTHTITASGHADFDLTGSFTLEVWFNAASIPSGVEVLLGRTDGFASSAGLQIWLGREGGTGNLWFWIKDASNVQLTALKGTSPTLDEWHHLAGILDFESDTAKIFLDGVENAARATPAFTGSFASTKSSPFEIGSLNNCCFFNGALDEPAVYDRALGADEILSHYEDGLAGLAICEAASGPCVTITDHPLFQTVCEGDTATFAVSVSGTPPFAYQWRKDGFDLAGETNDTLVLPGVLVADAGIYDVVVESSCGSATSAGAPLTVETGPSIIDPPQSQTAAVGDPVTFGVTATGTNPIEYQWRKDGVDIPGAVGTTFSIPSVALDDAGDYDVVLSNFCDPSVVSPTATLTVEDGEEDGRVTAGLLALYTFMESGGGIVHDVSGAGTPLDLAIGTPSAVGWIPGGGLSVLAPTVINSGVPAAKISNAIVASGSLTIEAWVRPANLTQTGPARIAALSQNGFPDGGNFMLGQRSGPSVFTARLRTSTTDQYGKPPLETAATTSLTHVVYTRAANGSRQLFINGTLARNGTIGGDFSTWNGAYTLTLANEPPGDRPWLGDFHLVAFYDRNLSPAEIQENFASGIPAGDFPPSITAQPASATKSPGETATFSVTAGGTAPLSYQWQRNGSDISGAASPTYTTPPLTLADDGATFRCVVSNDAGVATSTTALLTVVPPPPAAIGVSLAPTLQTVMPGENAAIEITVSNPGGVPLSGVTVTDADCTTLAFLGGDGNGDALLDTSESWLFECTIEAVAGDLTTTVEASGFDGSDEVIDTATAEVRVGARVTSGLIALYNVDEGAGTVLHDTSGFGAPLDLEIQSSSAVSWIPGGGISVDAPTLITSPGAATKLADRLVATRALTIEGWFKPANLSQTGPARIVAFSKDAFPNGANFMIGQDGAPRYSARLRTSTTDQYGKPPIEAPLTTALAHVVFTRSADGARRLYIDGVEAAAGTIAGDFSNWVSTYSLSLANEPSNNRPWLGEMHLVAIFDRALTPTEVAQNFAAGISSAPMPPAILGDPASITVTEGESASFAVSAAGTPPLEYQWQRNGSDIPGADLPQYTLPAATLGDDGALFRCVVSSSEGSATSASATLTVLPLGEPAVDIEVAPETQAVVSGSDAAFTFAVTNPGAAPLTGVVVSDLDCDTLTGPSGDDGDGVLETDESWFYTCTVENVTADFTTIATVDATGNGTAVSDFDTANVTVESRATAGLVALYTFEETSGTSVPDVSGFGAPLDLTIADPSRVEWIPGGGLAVTGSVAITAPDGSKVGSAIIASQSLTVEAWVRPANTTQGGPARIVSLSRDPFPTGANFMLGQEGSRFVQRLRSTSSDQYGRPPLQSPAGSASTDLVHVVFTREANGSRRLYVNGSPVASDTRAGTFSNWVADYALTLANEPQANRPWLGDLHLVAVYARALAETEVQANFAAGF